MQENELILLLLGIFVIFLIVHNRSQIRRFPFSSLLLGSYAILFMGWILTLLEDIYMFKLFNTLEHLCYLASAALLFQWVWKNATLHRKDNSQK